MKTLKILALLAVLIFSLQAFSDNRADVDLWGNLGFVKALPWQQGFDYVNKYSFTEPDRPWINHEWLSEYILHVTYICLGSSGPLILKVFLGLCVLAMIYTAMRRFRCSAPVEFFLLILITSTMGYGFSTRPHLFTYVLYAFFLLSLMNYRRKGTKAIFILPVLGILWANLHGAFFAGAVLLILYAVFETIGNRFTGNRKDAGRPMPVLAAAVLFIAASFINPYGPKLWRFIFESAAKSRQYLSEWAPFSIGTYLSEHPDFIILAILSFAAICLAKRRRDITMIGLMAVSFLAALAMRRNIPLFAITAAFVVPPYVEDLAGPPLKRIGGRFSRRMLITALTVFIIISALSITIFRGPRPMEIEIPRDMFTTGSMEFIEMNDISGNAIVFFDWAEHSIWKLYPKCRVFIDGRFRSAYSEEVIDDYFNFLYMNGDWEKALRDYPVDIVLIHKKNPACREIYSRVDWQLVYGDGIAKLFLKKGGHGDFFENMAAGQVKYPMERGRRYFP